MGAHTLLKGILWEAIPSQRAFCGNRAHMDPLQGYSMGVDPLET